MNAHTFDGLLFNAAGLAMTMWMLRKIVKALASLMAAIAAVAAVLVGLWLLIKGVIRLINMVLTHWRISVAVAALLAWCWWVSGPP